MITIIIIIFIVVVVVVIIIIVIVVIIIVVSPLRRCAVAGGRISKAPVTEPPAEGNVPGPFFI